MHVAIHTRDAADPHAAAYSEAIRLMGTGVSRWAAAKQVGMNAMTLWNRLERYRAAHGLPPLPDARRGPRTRSARASA